MTGDWRPRFLEGYANISCCEILQGKLSSRYIGLFEIIEHVRKVPYRIALPPQLLGIHNVFHMSMLRKYVHDPSHMINHKLVPIRDDLTFMELV